MMPRLTVLAAALLLASPLLAGCVGRAPPAEVTSPTPVTNGSTTFVPGVPGFAVEDLRVTPKDDTPRPLREDDSAVVSYTLRNRASGGNATSFLVSFSLNGDVRAVDTITLAPGRFRNVTHELGVVRDLRSIDVQVRAGDQVGSLRANVTDWPRTGDRVDLGPIYLTVNRWLQNESTRGTNVNVTVERKEGPDSDYHALRARVLCVDDVGTVRSDGEARPEVAAAGAAAMTDLVLPGCADTIYGVDFTGRDATGNAIYDRVLFVDRGWRPPHS